MKIFTIKNKKITAGYLLYFKRSQEYVIELVNNLDKWDVPVLFQKFVEEKETTIYFEEARMWVQERIIPSNRQNIGFIMRNSNIKEYSDIKLLELAHGECSQDDFYIEEIKYDALPENVKCRYENNLKDCFISDGSLICMFKDNTVRKFAIKILNDARIACGGYSIHINGNYYINEDSIKKDGILLNVTAKDFEAYLSNLISTSDACNILGCSRQNLNYLVKKDKVKPAISSKNESYFSYSIINNL